MINESGGQQLAAINLECDEFHPEWNYTITPRVDY